MTQHIQTEKVSTNLTVRRCLGCGDAGGSNPNASDAQKLAFADWFRFKHKDCADRVQPDKNYLRLVEIDEARTTRSNLLRFPVRLELPFKATIEIGNMKDLSFPDFKSFATQAEAIEWLESRAADSVCVTGGQVENQFASVVYILADEFFGCEV